MAQQRARQSGIGTLVRGNARIYAMRPALIEDDTELTWADLERRTNRLARTLRSQGIGKGDRVALLLNDGIQFIELLIATGKAGAIAVLLNWRLAPEEIAWILADSAPTAIYRADRFAGLLAGAPDIADHVVADDPLAAATYQRWACEGTDAPLADEGCGDDPLFMMFTSGTTGRPKGCLHSHNSTLASAQGFAGRRGFGRDDRNLSTNPLFHVAGLGHVFSAMVVGGANVFVSRDAPDIAPFEIAVRHGCTIATLSLPLMKACRLAGDDAGRLLRFRSLTGGAGMGDPRSFAFVAEQWGAQFVGGWGQTEAWGFATQIDWPDMLEHPRAIGWPIPVIEACVLDDKGHPHGDSDAEGELGIRGPNVMLGYWNNPEATEAALGTGWLRTGDIVVGDGPGLFTMKGRVKELIKSGGENVYPVEVETVIRELPGVADAAVAGVSDRKWGEVVKAFIVLEEGACVTAEDITLACRARIAGYKRPRYIEFIDAIPKDHAGKIRRMHLSARPVTEDQAAH